MCTPLPKTGRGEGEGWQVVERRESRIENGQNNGPTSTPSPKIWRGWGEGSAFQRDNTQIDANGSLSLEISARFKSTKKCIIKH